MHFQSSCKGLFLTVIWGLRNNHSQNDQEEIEDMSRKYLAGARTAGSLLSNNIRIGGRKINLHKTPHQYSCVRNKISPKVSPVSGICNWESSTMLFNTLVKTNLLLARMHQPQTASQITGDRHLGNCKKPVLLRPLLRYKQIFTICKRKICCWFLFFPTQGLAQEQSRWVSVLQFHPNIKKSLKSLA